MTSQSENQAPETSRAVRGAVMAVFLQWTLRLCGLVSVFIMARLLSPADFGMLGLAMTAVALVEIFSYIGLRQVLLRMEDPDRSYLDTAWTIQLIIFFTLGALLALISPLIARFYDEPALTPVMIALSLRFVLLGLVNIGIVDFDRHFQFGRDLAMRLSSRLISLVISIAAAVILRNYWALVAGMLGHAVCMTLFSYVLHPYRPRFSLVRKAELIGVSVWMFLGLAAQTIQGQVDRVALGRMSGAETVGSYTVSKDLATIFTHEIATALNRVSFVTTTRSGEFSDQGARIGALLGAYALVTAPLGVGLAAVADNFIAVFLGDQWGAAAQLLLLLGPAGTVFAVYKLIASSLQAGGFAKVSAAVGGLGLLITIIAIIGTIQMGMSDPMAIAATTFASCIATLLAGTFVIAHYAHAKIWSLLIQIGRPFGAAAIMLWAVTLLPEISDFALVELFVQAGFGAAVYALATYLLWFVTGRPQGAETEAVSSIRGALARFVPSRVTQAPEG